MKIAIVWKNDYPWDVRVEKIAEALIAWGHEVHIIARNLNRLPCEETLSGMHIHRLKHFRSSALNNMMSLPLFLNPLWFLTIRSICIKHGIDALIIRDLPLVTSGIFIGRRLGIPVVLDMAENYPALWQEIRRPGLRGIPDAILKNPRIAKRIEKHAVRNCDQVIVVADEAKAYLTSENTKSDNIVLVGNTPRIKELDRLRTSSDEPSLSGHDVLLYQGFVTKGRGLDVAIRAMPALIKEFRNLRLVIVGVGDDLGRLRNLAKELNVDAFTVFMGWVNSKRIPGLINASTIGVIPHYATEHKNTTIPNKLFDYMACAKPVLVSSARPLKRIVEEESCGEVFESGDVESYANAVRRMLLTPQKAIDMGRMGRDAVLRKYNWDIDCKQLQKTLDAIYPKKDGSL